MRGRFRRHGLAWGRTSIAFGVMWMLFLAVPPILPDGAHALSRPLRPSAPPTITPVRATSAVSDLPVLLEVAHSRIVSSAVTGVTWKEAPSAPTAEVTLPGLSPRSISFPVVVASDADSFTLLVDGKYAWSRRIRPPSRLMVELALAPGVHTVELRAANPLRRASTAVKVAAAVWPVPGHEHAGSSFGMRFHPILRITRMHKGVDIGAPQGSRVVAAGPGTVAFAGWRGGYGNTVIVDHGGGTLTQYSHLSEIAVGHGERVTAGERVGEVGSTGLSTGPHLHFEVRVHGEPRDPMDYL